MKKHLLYIVIPCIILILAFFFSQIYHINNNDGNLIFYINNESKKDTVLIEVYINDSLLISDYLSNKSNSLYTKYSCQTTMKTHNILIKVDGHFAEKFELNTILATWLIIDFMGEEYEEPIVIDKLRCPPSMFM